MVAWANDGEVRERRAAEAPYLVSSCRRVLISQMGLVAVMAVNPGKFRKTEVQTDVEAFWRTQL